MANMQYETAADTPEPGTIKEILFLILQGMREDAVFKSVLFSGFATMAASSESEEAGKKVQESLTEYMNSQFPYMREEAEKKEQELRDVLKSQTEQAFRISRTESPMEMIRNRRGRV